jgi:large subunit ribosomal protein L7/L12
VLTPGWSPEVVALGDRIAALNRARAAELRRYLDEAYGLRAADVVVVEQDQADALDGATRPEPTVLSVRLDGHDDLKKIAVIRAVRELTGAGLLRARSLVENVPALVAADLPRAEAERFRDVLEAAGGVVSLV